MKKNVVLGGGISGLATAYYLSKFPKIEIKLFESSQRLGGWIKSTQTKNGTIFEHGPRTLRCGGQPADNTLFLAKELGLHPKIKPVLRTHEAVRNRMIYVDDELIKLPNSWTSLFKINPPFIKPFIFAILNDLKSKKKTVPDESVYDFVTRRFGKEYADIPLSAMICGIFAGDAKEISVKALMNGLFEKEQTYGSVCKGLLYSIKNNIVNYKHNEKWGETQNNAEFRKWSMWSLENGLETLPKCIGQYLKTCDNTEVFLNSKCSKVVFKDKEVLLKINGKIEYGEHLFSSIPSKDLATILDDEHLFLKRELSLIPFVTVATVNLEYDDDDLLKPKGFGFLVPPNQNLPLLGIIFDSCIFPQANKTVLSVMLGGKWFAQHFGTVSDTNKFIDIAKYHVLKILNIDKEPINAMVTLLHNCIPQYVVGHFERIQRIRKYIAEHELPLTIIGNSFDGVGVNDAIFSAKTNVHSTMEWQRVKIH